MAKAKDTQTKKIESKPMKPRMKMVNLKTTEGKQQVMMIDNMHKTLRRLITLLKKQRMSQKEYEGRVEAAMDKVTANTDQLQSKLTDIEGTKKTQQKVEMLPIRDFPAKGDRLESSPALLPGPPSPLPPPSPPRQIRDRSPSPTRQIRVPSPSPARQMAVRSP